MPIIIPTPPSVIGEISHWQSAHPRDMKIQSCEKETVEMMQDAGYSIQIMAARCGMTAHTLRYYERVGLIQPVWRGRNGHRRYSNQDGEWLKFLKTMRATYMSIREMKRYAALREGGNNRVDEQREILENHRVSLETRIADLRNAQALLTHKIEQFSKLSETERGTASESLPQWAA
jgi:DNA-binding transcriptional MerR regulator